MEQNTGTLLALVGAVVLMGNALVELARRKWPGKNGSNGNGGASKELGEVKKAIGAMIVKLDRNREFLEGLTTVMQRQSEILTAMKHNQEAALKLSETSQDIQREMATSQALLAQALNTHFQAMASHFKEFSCKMPDNQGG